MHEKIGIISDTHGWLDIPMNALDKCGEIWHAGDIGSEEVYDKLAAMKPLRAVYGNMDGGNLRYVMLRQFEFFHCEEVPVLLHIGGYQIVMLLKRIKNSGLSTEIVCLWTFTYS